MTAELWWTVAVGLLTPVMMIACHPVFVHQSRRPPSSWSGYRTPRAASSRRAWTIAQVMCARLWARSGAMLTGVTLAGYGMLYASGNRDADTWWWTALAFALTSGIGMLWSAVVIERHLRELGAASTSA